jgi:hypothetical protein
VNLPPGFPPPIELLGAGLEIPIELRASLLRHEQHLAQLVSTLQAAGLSAEMIDASVSQLVESYREELVLAIHGMVGMPPHA